MPKEEKYSAEMAPSLYIEKVALLTGETISEEVLPHQLLVHSHRDYHVIDVQARWLMSRLVDAVGDEDKIVAVMKSVRQAGLKATDLLGKVIGSSTSNLLAKNLVGLKGREYYFRYKKHPLNEKEIHQRLVALREEAATKLAAVTDDSGTPALRVLLTGGTGFVGKEVIWQAARDKAVVELVVVVRPKTIRDRKTREVLEVISPAKRGEALLKQLWLDDESAAKVRFIAGDIEEPFLGLSEEDIVELSTSITHVIHSAASVSFDDPYEASYRANVEGAKNALAFAYRLQTAEGSPFVAHIGIETSYIHGRQTHQPAREEEIVFPRNFYNNYYELTKAMGSIETDRYMLEKGLRVIQLCPAIVIGEGRTGNNRGDTKVVNAPVNVFGRVKGATEEGAWHERSKARLLGTMACTFPGDPTAELNIIPVDWVVKGIVASLKSPKAVGERVHLATDSRLTSDEMRNTIKDELEVDVRLSEPTLHRTVTLPAMTLVLKTAGQDRVANGLEKLGQIFGGYSEWGQPVHEVGNDQKLLGLPERPNTQEAFRMLCRHNRWVQNFGQVRDLDEVSRREKIWLDLIDVLEKETGGTVGKMSSQDFRIALEKRVNIDGFSLREEGDTATQQPLVQESLGAVDAAWLQMDRPENRMVITAMVQFDEEQNIAELRKTIEERLLRFERFRQRVVPAQTLELLPTWETDPHFDLDNHVRTAILDGEQDDDALNVLVNRLVSSGLDPKHPPWQIHVVKGWKGGGAMVVRLHHCIGDGAALVYVMLSLTDAVSTEEPSLSDSETSAESRGTMARLTRAIKKSGVVLHERIATLSDPRNTMDLAKAGAAGMAAIGKLMLMPSDPPSSLRGELGVAKHVAWSNPISLARVKVIRRATGATVNDVLMAALTGALRRYLTSEEDNPQMVESIRAIVPVNLRPPDEAPELGNRFGLIFLDLPVGLDHEVERLDEIRKSMDIHKASPAAFISLKALDGLGRIPEAVEEGALRHFTGKATLVASNVPGPYERLNLAGRPVKSCMFWVPQSGDIGVGVSILSYAGEIRIGVSADINLVPNPKALIQAFEDEIELLGRGLSGESQ